MPSSVAPPARLAAALALLALLAADPAAAQRPRAWSPPAAHDSLASWAAEARQRLAEARGDSVTGANWAAFERVGLIARRLLRGYGREAMGQVGAVGAALDSLGFDTDVAVDPANPGFALLTVRHPERPAGRAAGFLYWFRGADLRMQGVALAGGHAPSMRVWWTGDPRQPYSWGLVERAGTRDGAMQFLLFRLSQEGSEWRLAHDETLAPVLGEPGEAALADLNRDGRPELVSWTDAGADSTLALCAGCPRLLTERTFVERPPGFELFDSRLAPSPLATITLFLRLLREGNRAAAARLVADAKLVERAIADGWNAPAKAGAWRLEYAEPNQPWPRWFAMRYESPRGTQRWIVHFTSRDARWIVRDWIPLREGASPAPAGR